MREAATILRTGHKCMGKNGPWNWRLTVPKITKMILVRPPMTNLKLRVALPELHVAPARTPPPTLCIKAFTLCLSGVGSQPLDRCPPPFIPCKLPASEIKQTFPFHQPGLFIDLWAYWAASSGPTSHLLLTWSFLQVVNGLVGEIVNFNVSLKNLNWRQLLQDLKWSP